MTQSEKIISEIEKISASFELLGIKDCVLEFETQEQKMIFEYAIKDWFPNGEKRYGLITELMASELKATSFGLFGRTFHLIISKDKSQVLKSVI